MCYVMLMHDGQQADVVAGQSGSTCTNTVSSCANLGQTCVNRYHTVPTCSKTVPHYATTVQTHVNNVPTLYQPLFQHCASLCHSAPPCATHVPTCIRVCNRFPACATCVCSGVSTCANKVPPHVPTMCHSWVSMHHMYHMCQHCTKP